MGHADARNVSLALVARGLPLNRQHMFALWAADDASSMEVGHFMVDHSGGCRVRFNLPANHSWSRFWVSQPRRCRDRREHVKRALAPLLAGSAVAFGLQRAYR